MQKLVKAISRGKKHVPFFVLCVLLLAALVISALTTTKQIGVNAVPSISYEQSVPSTGSRIFNGNGIALDSNDNMFVINRSNPTDIKKINATGDLVTQWGSYGSGNGQFSLPHIVAVDNSDNVYVTDENFYVQKFDNNGNFVYKIGGYGTGDGQFSSLIYLAFDSSNNMYATGSNGTIQKFDISGNFVSRIGSAGTGDGQFNSSGPYGVAIDSNDNIFAVDSSRIQKFDSSGTFVTKWGSSGCCGSGFFSSPRYIAIDSSDNVYVGQISGQYMVQ
ncbi:hypothetical protein KC722_03420, partial [Candidatus Kaiserbacteria bacterium]|nr:hypothetical protein [Candidatus Kaiserbacteria bacterium]